MGPRRGGGEVRVEIHARGWFCALAYFCVTGAYGCGWSKIVLFSAVWNKRGLLLRGTFRADAFLLFFVVRSY